jgi:ubiquinone/menaquinone biosynthesis C-methylase UbiE
MTGIQTTEMVDHEDRHWWHVGRRRILCDVLARCELPQEARLLDAGCGAGGMLSALNVYGSVSGLDMNPELVALARQRGYEDVVAGIVEELPWVDESFDLVTLLDVLEHTADDLVTLEEMRRVIRPGGHLLVTVPAYQVLWSNHDVVNDHYRRYSRRTLHVAACSAGWSVERMTPFNSLLLAPAAAVRLTQKLRREQIEAHTPDARIGPSWLHPVLELPLRAEASWLRRNHSLPAGLSLLAHLRCLPATPEA